MIVVVTISNHGRTEKLSRVRGTHGEREPITGDWGRAPSQGAKPPEAERFSALECLKKWHFWPFLEVLGT